MNTSLSSLACFCISTALVLSRPAVAADSVQISSDPFTNPTSQHMTEVEPDVFAYGSMIVATFHQGRIYGGAGSDVGFATSYDSGASWAAGSLPGLTRYYGEGDNLAAGDSSVVYNVAYGTWLIACSPLSSVGLWREILVSRSQDGINWDDPIAVVTGEGSPNFDKPWITCDNTPASPYFGNCYVEWDNANQGDRILMSASRDGGVTWEPPLTTADLATGLGGQPLVQPSGLVVVPYLSLTGELRAFVSDDGGETWSGSATISRATAHRVAGGLRAPGLPSAGMDGDGKVYVVWEDCRFRSSCQANDIVFSTSLDGIGWSEVNRIPISEITSAADHFIPGLAVDAATSGKDVHLALAYYYYPDAACTLSTCQLIGGFITSLDGGNSWSLPVDMTEPIGLSWLANTSQGRMVGDYIATYFTEDGSAHPVFAAATMPEGTTFFESTHTATYVPGLAPRIVRDGALAILPAPDRRITADDPTAIVLTATVNAKHVVDEMADAWLVNIGGEVRITAEVTGIANTAVRCSLPDGPATGSLRSSGLSSCVYTAPLRPGTYHVRLASIENANAVATVEIIVYTVK